MKRRRPPPSPEELRARAKRLADDIMSSKPYDDDASSSWGIEDAATKAKRYVNAQCRARKAEIARGTVSTLSQGGADAGGHPKREEESADPSGHPKRQRKCITSP